MATLRPHRVSATLASFALVVALSVAGAVLGGSQALAGPVRCGDTITADTTLAADLLDCPNNGIVIGADDITLDLNGHTIDGDNALADPCPEDEFCDFGIANDGHNGVRITNGTVRQFAFGVIALRRENERPEPPIHGRERPQRYPACRDRTYARAGELNRSKRRS